MIASLVVPCLDTAPLLTPRGLPQGAKDTSPLSVVSAGKAGLAHVPRHPCILFPCELVVGRGFLEVPPTLAAPGDDDEGVSAGASAAAGAVRCAIIAVLPQRHSTAVKGTITHSQTHRHTYTHTHTYTHKHIYAHVDARTYTCTHIHTHIYIVLLACVWPGPSASTSPSAYDLYLVHEYAKHDVAGVMMTAWQRGALTPLSFRRRLAFQLASGVQRFHARGMVLRDLSPLNLLLSADGSVRLFKVGEPTPPPPVPAAVRGVAPFLFVCLFVLLLHSFTPQQ